MMPQIAATKNYAGYVRRQRGGVIEGVESKEAEGEGAETETIKCQVFHEQQRMLSGARGSGAERQSERRRVFYAVLHLLAADRMECGKGEA